jgi:uncharacterized protein YkwD
MRSTFRLFSLFWLLLALPAGAAADSAGRVLEALQDERGKTGAGRLARRADLDEVARARAMRIAGLRHEDRLSLGESIEARLHDAGIKKFRNATVHLDMVRGYTDPAKGFLKSWRGYSSAWSKALEPRFTQVGIATANGDDGWIILVAVMLEMLPQPEDPRKLEQKAFKAVNDIRREHGLPELARSAALAEVARAHCVDMAGRNYFAHESPDGLRARDRVEAAGIEFSALGENIQSNHHFDDPVEQAVNSWMKSTGHRKNILKPIFTVSGVGVVIDDDGKVYFTQLFMRPPGD